MVSWLEISGVSNSSPCQCAGGELKLIETTPGDRHVSRAVAGDSHRVISVVGGGLVVAPLDVSQEGWADGVALA